MKQFIRNILKKYQGSAISINTAILLKLAVAVIIVIAARVFVVNSTLFLDSNTIHTVYLKVCDDFFCGKYFDSYYNVARFFAVITLCQGVSYNVLFILGGLLWCLAYVFMIKSIRIKDIKLFLPVSILFVFDALFMLQPAKDTFVLLINTIVVLFLTSNMKNRFLYIAGLFVLEGIFVKPYILIFLVIYGLVHLFLYNKKYGCIVLACGVVGFVLMMQMGHLDFLVNARIIADANTTIEEIFPKSQLYGNSFLFIINYLVSLVRMLFPFELFIKAPTRAIVFVSLQMGVLLLWYMGLKYIINRHRESLINREDENIRECLIILIVYTMVSALFEPDFGSIFRHQCGYLPFYIYLLFSAEWSKNDKNQ